MKVDPTKTQPPSQSAFEGELYYFCGAGCKKKFDANPAGFLQPKPAPAPAAAAQAAVSEYTCPMDPEVRQLGPGSCPKCGMALEPSDAAETADDHEYRGMRRRFWICAALTVPLLLMMFLEIEETGWWQFALATAVVFWGGAPFFARGLASLRNRHLNMFTLIAMGTGAAYLFSVVGLLKGLPLYFEPAAVIVTLVLLGQVLELRARSQTSSALKSLLRLAPASARLANGNEVSLDRVKPGDLLRVRPGEKVPVDGVLVEGGSAVDESLVTGEAMPVEKSAGSKLTGGTLNATGSFVMRAERVGADTLLSQIVKLVGEAQRTRAPIQRLADKVSAFFVPAVLVVAAATFAVWFRIGPQPRLSHALVNAVAVLIVACPCALGLATPMSIMVGTGRGAIAGVLVRNAEALETLQEIDTLVVDKTGTLTLGKPQLMALETYNGYSEEGLLSLAASVEQASEHPLAGAILAAARAAGIVPRSVSHFEALPGMGAKATVDGRQVLVGNRRLLENAGIAVNGEYSVAIAVDGKAVGVMSFTDPLKPSTKDAVDWVRNEGIRLVLLSGDTLASANAIARQLEIKEVIAGVLPGEKADVISKLRSEGRIVAMAGDGVNDAPALARAQVGIAMSTGAAVAIENAGITLLGGDLAALVRAIRLSRATVANIRQNLFFAFFYNMVGVPVAAGVLFPFFGLLLSPMIASAAMTFSSLSVIANALRLRNVRI